MTNSDLLTRDEAIVAGRFVSRAALCRWVRHPDRKHIRVRYGVYSASALTESLAPKPKKPRPGAWTPKSQ